MKILLSLSISVPNNFVYSDCLFCGCKDCVMFLCRMAPNAFSRVVTANLESTIMYMYRWKYFSPCVSLCTYQHLSFISILSFYPALWDLFAALYQQWDLTTLDTLSKFASFVTFLFSPLLTFVRNTVEWPRCLHRTLEIFADKPIPCQN